MFRSSGQNCWHNRLVRTAVETWWSNAGSTSEFSFHGSCQPVSNHSSGLAVTERGPDWSHRLRWKKVVVTLLRCLQRKKVYSPKMKWSNVVRGCHLTGRKAPQSSSDRGILGGFWRAKELQLLSYLGFSNVSIQSFFFCKLQKRNNFSFLKYRRRSLLSFIDYYYWILAACPFRMKCWNPFWLIYYVLFMRHIFCLFALSALSSHFFFF